MLASCAQTVSIDVELRPGVRVVRALSRDGKIEGQTAQFQLNQVYAATEHYVLMEVEVDQSVRRRRRRRELGRVRVSYTAAQDGARQTIETPVRARFSAVRHRGRGEPRQCGDRVGDRAERARANRGGDRAARPGPARRGAGAVPAERQGDRGAGRRRAALGPPAISQAAISTASLPRRRQRHAPGRPAQVPAADGFEPGSAGRTVLSGGKCGSGAGGSGQRRRFSGYV